MTEMGYCDKCKKKTLHTLEDGDTFSQCGDHNDDVETIHTCSECGHSYSTL